MEREQEQIRFLKVRSLLRVLVGLAVLSAAAILGVTILFGFLCREKLGDAAENLMPYVIPYLAVCMVVIAAVLLVVWAMFRKRVQEPIRKISETAEHYAQDRADGMIDDFCFGRLNLGTGDEFEELTGILAGMERDIAKSERELLRATAEKQRIRTELNVANDIQENMLPNLFPPFPDRTEFEIFASMDPAKEIGGDFYDFFLLDDRHLALVMADVSGKGIPAALFMMSSMIIIDNFARMGFSPKKVLELSNETICQLELSDMFVTVWFGILDLESGVVTAANAGHEYPAFRKADGEFELIQARHGFVIGGLPGMKYKEHTFRMEPGDVLFLYTDGVPEASRQDNEMYGTDRMLIALNEAKDLKPEPLLKSVRADIDAFVKSAPQFDDLTMLCLEYYGSKTPLPEGRGTDDGALSEDRP